MCCKCASTGVSNDDGNEEGPLPCLQIDLMTLHHQHHHHHDDNDNNYNNGDDDDDSNDDTDDGVS